MNKLLAVLLLSLGFGYFVTTESVYVVSGNQNITASFQSVYTLQGNKFFYATFTGVNATPTNSMLIVTYDIRQTPTAISVGDFISLYAPTTTNIYVLTSN